VITSGKVKAYGDEIKKVLARNGCELNDETFMELKAATFQS
jgi:hypothetical protein